MYNQFSENNTKYYLAPGIKIILIANLLIFLILEISNFNYSCINVFGLNPANIYKNKTIWQIFTYLFLHGNILHIFFNMLMLWLFGNSLENRWGKNKFLFFYFLCGSGAGLVTAIVQLHSDTIIIGASGAIYGVLIAYGFLFPNRLIFLYGLFPIQVKYIIFLLAFISFTSSMFVLESTISHITHLAGMAIGLSYVLYDKRTLIYSARRDN